MQTEDETPIKKKTDKGHASSDTLVCVEKVETPKKVDKSGIAEPKPRIVLTFRSEKSSAKTTNMKIVSPEEKDEDVSPRRSSRSKGKWEWMCDGESVPSASPKTDENISQSENDESDNSYTPPRLRRRGVKDDVIACAIARKEKSYNEATPTGPQRLSRRIKPTAKILANEELRIGLESPNNARLGIQSEKTSDEGVRTRRAARPVNTDNKHKDPQNLEGELDDDSQSSNSQVMKLKHLCELGLKAINPEAEDTPDGDEDSPNENKEDQDTNDNDEEADDDSEVISKLLEADDQGTSDEEFYCAVEASRREVRRPRRSSRFYSAYGADEGDRTSPPADDENTPSNASSKRAARRSQTSTQDRSKRRKNRSCDKEEEQSEVEPEETSDPAGGDEGAPPACPPDETTIVATCSCEKPSNIYAAPSELTEPVFCQAIEVVDGVRVGCSHSARKEASAFAPLVRAGPRTPYFLACTLHTSQFRKHMCCSSCGLFCTQGVFYQCSQGHLFHLECGLPCSEGKLQAGCPHCGMSSYHWQPANSSVARVRLHMHCSNRRVFLPDQREQCKPAYLGFSQELASPEQEPLIPDDLLPPLPSDWKQIMQKAEESRGDFTPEDICAAILSGESLDQLITMIASGVDLDAPLAAMEGGTCAHAASACGHVAALHLLHLARASLDAADGAMRTPLMRAVLALLDKSEEKPTLKENVKHTEEMETDQIKEEEKIEDKEIMVVEKTESGTDRAKDEDLLKVIKYLVAVGCDVNASGPDGMCALHMAAQLGGRQACAALLAAPGAAVDARDLGGWTPLVWAAENKHAHVVRLLLERGADPLAADGEGNGPVHWCALAGHAASLRELLHRAPDAHAAANRHADTPLHVAARQGHYACVITLLARGARTDVENSAGELPLAVCSGPCHDAISLNMQMTLALADTLARRRLLSNDISNGRELHPIPCINEVDDEPLPDFTYVTENVTPIQINIDSTIESLQGCTCAGGACDAQCACATLSVRRWAAGGRLLPGFPHQRPPMLFECNATCACNAKRCSNRAVGSLEQAGSLGVSVSVARVAGRGWGLVARAAVARGAAVALYRGELLPLPAADARATDHYMFSLDINPDLIEQCAEKTQLCIDAAVYGSAARFVNHSCSPNLSPVRVFTKTRDLRLPTVTLFATRDIRGGEELTFDYGDKFWSVKSKWMKCECGSIECRYPEKTTEETES